MGIWWTWLRIKRDVPRGHRTLWSVGCKIWNYENPGASLSYHYQFRKIDVNWEQDDAGHRMTPYSDFSYHPDRNYITFSDSRNGQFLRRWWWGDIIIWFCSQSAWKGSIILFEAHSNDKLHDNLLHCLITSLALLGIDWFRTLWSLWYNICLGDNWYPKKVSFDAPHRPLPSSHQFLRIGSDDKDAHGFS